MLVWGERFCMRSTMLLICCSTCSPVKFSPRVAMSLVPIIMNTFLGCPLMYDSMLSLCSVEYVPELPRFTIGRYSPVEVLKASGQQCMSVMLLPMNTILSLSVSRTLNESYLWLRNGSSANIVATDSSPQMSKVNNLFIKKWLVGFLSFLVRIICTVANIVSMMIPFIK